MNAKYLSSTTLDYMIFEEDVPYEEDYRFHMLLSHSISGILPCNVRFVDGQTRFYYDITGKRTLKKEAEEKRVGKMLFARLLYSIIDLKKESSDYLLQLKNIVLLPEYIYLDKSQFYFCFFPLWEADEGTAVNELIKSLLPYVDAADTEALSCFHHVLEQTENKEPLAKIMEDFALYEKENSRMKSGIAEAQAEDEDMAEEDLLYSGIDSRLKRRKLRRLRVKKRKCSKKAERKEKGGRKRRGLIYLLREKKRRRDPYSDFNNDFDDDFEEDAATTLLVTESSANTLVLYSDSGEDRIAVRSSPYIIGSARKNAEEGIWNPAVSRKHARLEKLAGQWFLEDLESTNGTFHNGRRLMKGERVALSGGDEVAFANALYHVYFSTDLL